MMKKAGLLARLMRAASVAALVVAALLSLGQSASAGSKQVSGQAAPKGPAPSHAGSKSVPEIQPALLVGTLVLVVGAAMILTDRARARRPD